MPGGSATLGHLPDDENSLAKWHSRQATNQEPDVNACSLALSIEVPLEPDEAFERFTEELSGSLRYGADGVTMRLEPGVEGGESLRSRTSSVAWSSSPE